MKILHISETALGGVGSYMKTLGQTSGPIENAFLVPEDHTELLKDFSTLYTFPYYGRGAKSLISLILTTRRIIREFSPDILFFHSSFSLVVMAACRVFGERMPMIYCSHGWAISQYKENSAKSNLFKIIEGTLCGLSSVTINISRHDLDVSVKNKYSGKHVLIENCVPPPRHDARSDIFSTQESDIQLLFVGRHDAQKGLDILLEAFRLAREERTNLRLHIIGASVREDNLTLSAPEACTFSGWVSSEQIDDFYASADLLVVPSRWEGFGLVVPESLRNGTPVLCSDRGALPSLVQRDVTGDIFELSVESLRSKLVNLDKRKIKTWAKSCRKSYADRFSPERFTKELDALYSSLINRNS